MLQALLALLSKLPAFNIINPLIGIMPVLAGLWGNVKKYWRFYLPVLLVVLNCGTLYGWRNTNTLLVNERASHAHDIATFRTAQEQANAQAEQVRQTIVKEAQANATQADAHYSTLLAQYHDSLMRYQADQRSTGSTQYYQYPTPSSSDGSSPSPIVSDGTTSSSLITISIDDANICAVNTARIMAVHDWAINLPKE